jgi:hypothetical protein
MQIAMHKERNVSFDDYAEIIMLDKRDRIVNERPTVYTDDRIERVYELDDGAIVLYQWQSPVAARAGAEAFNHRFTLTRPPTDNPAKLKNEIIKIINY